MSAEVEAAGHFGGKGDFDEFFGVESTGFRIGLRREFESDRSRGDAVASVDGSQHRSGKTEVKPIVGAADIVDVRFDVTKSRRDVVVRREGRGAEDGGIDFDVLGKTF